LVAGGSKDQFFDGKVVKTATGGRVPASAALMPTGNAASLLGPRDFIVYFPIDKEYWRLGPKEKDLWVLII
jgi:hypothetical protein